MEHLLTVELEIHSGCAVHRNDSVLSHSDPDMVYNTCKFYARLHQALFSYYVSLNRQVGLNGSLAHLHSGCPHFDILLDFHLSWTTYISIFLCEYRSKAKGRPCPRHEVTCGDEGCCSLILNLDTKLRRMVDFAPRLSLVRP
jgi:hypothetical protein